MGSRVLEELTSLSDLCASVGWNVDPRELQLQINTAQLMGLHEDGQRIANAMVFTYGVLYAFVGMVVIRSEYQRQGHGRSLMHSVLDFIGSKTVGLVSTVDGRGLYQSLGFHTIDSVLRMETMNAEVQDELETGKMRGITIREILEQDYETVMSLDARMTSVHRASIMNDVFAFSHETAVACSEGSGILGYACMRKRGDVDYIGPIMAETDDVAIALVRHLLGKSTAQVRMDVLKSKSTWISQLWEWGFKTTMESPYMQKGDLVNSYCSSIFAMIDPAIG